MELTSFVVQRAREPDPSQDGRPRCVLFIGDGFTRGLLAHYALSQQVVTSPMIPAPPSAMYEPTDSDMFERRPLWDRAIFPRVVRAWEAFSNAAPHGLTPAQVAQRFFSRLAARGRMPLTRRGDRDGVSFCSTGFRVEVRAYLWNLFKSYDARVAAEMVKHPADDWVWTNLLLDLTRHCRLTVVSYNYEFLLERLLMQMKLAVFSNPQQHLLDWTWRLPYEVPVFKPHGSIFHKTFGGMIRGPNLWLRNARIGNCGGRQFARFEPPKECPIYPDLVPPGHGKEHLANFRTDVASAIECAIVDADFVVLCGLSAAAPDTDELDGYLLRLGGRRAAVHVGLRTSSVNDEQNDAGRLLRQYASKYRFFSVGELPFVLDWVRHLPRRRRAKTKEGALTEMLGPKYDNVMAQIGNYDEDSEPLRRPTRA